MLRFSSHLAVGVTRAALLASALTLAACVHTTTSGGGRSVVSQGGEVGLLAREAPMRGAQREITVDELSWSPAPVVAVLAIAAVAAAGVAPPAALVSSALRTAGTAPTAPHVELWRGTYVGGTYAQRGALALLLRATAEGTPATGAGGMIAWRVKKTPGDFGAPRSPGRDSAVLVRVPVVATQRDSDRVVLRLDTYFDPACNCTVRATFSGIVRGDTLSGRFTINGAATIVGEERGRWRAVRVRGTP